MRDCPARDRIVEAYVDLLTERRTPDITIKELVFRAGSNRNTFYYHFSKTDDIAELVMESFFESFYSAHEPFHSGAWADTGTSHELRELTDTFRFAREHSRELVALLNSSLRLEFLDRWVAVILEEYERYDYQLYEVDGTPVHLTDQELGYHLRTLAHAIVAYMEFWADTGFTETSEELAKLMPRLMGLSTAQGQVMYRIKRAGE